MSQNCANIINILREKEEFILLSHHNSDPDAICASIVLKKYLVNRGKEVRIGVPKSVNKLSKKILDKFEENVTINPDLKKSEEIIILDTPSYEQLEPIDLRDRKFYAVDHHHPQDIITNAAQHYDKTETTSTCELVYELFDNLEYELNEEESILLMLGIIYDTGHLKHGNSETFKVMSELISKTEKSYGEVTSFLYTKTDISERIAKLKSARRMDIYRINDYIIVFSKIGSFESSSASSLVKFSADIAIVGNKNKDEVRISGRCNKSISKKVDLANDAFKHIRNIIGGSAGGHRSAASANGKKPDSLNKAFDEILKRLEDKLEGKAKKLN